MISIAAEMNAFRCGALNPTFANQLAVPSRLRPWLMPWAMITIPAHNLSIRRAISILLMCPSPGTVIEINVARPSF